MKRHASVVLAGFVWLISMAAHARGIVSDTTENGVREIRGEVADARYQVAMPLSGDGRTILYVSPHYLGDENSSNTLLKPLALARGWVYVSSSEGYDYTSLHQNRWYEAKRRIIETVAVSKVIANSQYGRKPERTYIAGYSLGGHHTKWMIESTNVFDGGLSLAGLTSVMEWVRWVAFYARTYNGTPASVEKFTSQVSGFQFDQGLKPSYGPPLERELMGELAADPLTATAIGKLDPDYSGSPSAWDPDVELSISQINDLRRMDETGRLKSGSLKTPLLLVHGGSDAIVSPGCSIAYLNLVKHATGVTNANDVLRVFIIPEFTHFHFFEGGPPDFVAAGIALSDEALTALENWVNTGQAPASLAGIAPLQ